MDFTKLQVTDITFYPFYCRTFSLIADCYQYDFVLTLRKFTLLQHCLMFTLNWRNANQARVLGEMTLQNFDEKKVYDEKKKKILQRNGAGSEYDYHNGAYNPCLKCTCQN